MSYVRKASTLCTCFLLLAACESENEGGGNPAFSDRLITGIAGVEYYDKYENRSYERHSLNQFFYDDQKRLDRWISTDNDSEVDLQFFYESDERISIFGERRWEGETESIVAEIDLDAAGNIVRVDNTEDIFRFSYENGRLAQRTDTQGNTVTYGWNRGDLTTVRVTPSPYPKLEQYVESGIYGSEPNITNLDLNYFAYGMEYFALILEKGIGKMLGMAGFFGRNAHYVTENLLHEGDHGRYVWTFDRNGYPTGWTADYLLKGTMEKYSGWKYTIYYNDLKRNDPENVNSPDSSPKTRRLQAHVFPTV